MSTAKEVASAIVKSNFWPDVNPNAVLMLCYLAEAEGHHPAVVYRDYHIMSGKPAKKAEAILRDFITGGGKIEWHKLDDEAADATFSHPSGQARIRWDMARAKKANLNSTMWTKYPRQMLRSRCISEGVRTVYPGATSGLYEEGEVADIVAETTIAQPDAGDEAGGSQPEGEVDPPADNYAFPKGPATGITQLKAMARALWREIDGCGDLGELEPLLVEVGNKAIIEQCMALENPAHLEIWEGDGKDNPGLNGFIQRRRDELAQIDEFGVATPALSDADWSKLAQLMEATSSNAAKMLKALSINVTTLDDLDAAQYATVIDALETKLGKMAKKQTTAKYLGDEIKY